MRTAAFILFAIVTAAAAALSTLVASRYLSLERDLADTRARLDDVLHERKRQEEEKMALRLDRERIQSDLEGRMAEQRSQLDSCESKRQGELMEIAATLKILQKAVIDIQVQMGAVQRPEQGGPQGGSSSAAPDTGQKGGQPASQTDVPKGAIPTPEQEARKLNKAP